VRRVVSTLKAQQASIMILDPETGDLVTRASFGLEAEYSRGARQHVGEGIAGWVALHREAVQLDDRVPTGELARFYKAGRSISSAISLPLSIGERVVGVLNVNRIEQGERFGEHHVEVLRVFAEHIAAVVDRAEVLERMGQRARELEADNEKLTVLNRMKDVFLGTASHELKTPLTSVIAYAELLYENDERLTREQSHEFIGRLRTEAQRLLTLIEDILDLSRLESGKMGLRTQPMGLNDIASSAAETTSALAERHGVEFELELASDLPVLSLDEVKMRQVVVNLLVNAAKFSPRGGRVRLRTAREGVFQRLEVIDQGPGVSPDKAAHIFELFGQDVTASDARGGLGIGLHLVKRITELHGGTVGVNSEPGEGSVFWIRLPVVSVVEGGAPVARGEEDRAAA
jgi:signal transduction histidine kinase